MKPMSYGNLMLKDFLPECNYVGIEPKVYKPEFDDLEARLHEVLEDPLLSDPLEDIIKKNPNGRTIILVDDHTRPNEHTRKVLPYFLSILREEYKAKNVWIMFAKGSHRDPTSEEQRWILGDEVYESYKDRLLIHDHTKNCVQIGETSTRVPIHLNKYVVHAYLVVPFTDSELHYFKGTAGTVKHPCPGVAHEETIRITHSKMFDPVHGFKPECRLGNIENNPLDEDFKEITQKLSEKVNLFGVDTIMCGDEPVYLDAGDVLKLHEQAAPKIVEMRSVEVGSKADVTIVDPGVLGQNLYQTGKAINCGSYSVREGGKLIVPAPCNDGVGNDAYEKIMIDISKMSTKEALNHMLNEYCNEKKFKIGYQKPVDILRIKLLVGENSLYLLSEMKEDFVRKMGLQPIPRKYDPETDLRRYLDDVIEEDMTVHLIHDPGVLVRVRD